MGKEATFRGSTAFACHSWRHFLPWPCFEKGAIKKVTRFSTHKTNSALKAFSGKRVGKEPSFSLDKEPFFCNFPWCACIAKLCFSEAYSSEKTFFNFQRLLSFGDSWHAAAQQGFETLKKQGFSIPSSFEILLEALLSLFFRYFCNSVHWARNFRVTFELKAIFTAAAFHLHFKGHHAYWVFEKQLDIV